MVVVIMTPMSNSLKNTVTLVYGILTATLFGLCFHPKLLLGIKNRAITPAVYSDRTQTVVKIKR